MPASSRPPLAWHDGLLLGHASMDDEHRALVAQIGALQSAPDDMLPARLDELAARLHMHFDEEDRAMGESGFPPRDCHIGEHAAVRQSVAAVRRRLAGGDSAAARRLADELAAWFPGHAMHLDSALAHWLNKQRLGGKPVVLRRRLPAGAPVPC